MRLYNLFAGNQDYTCLPREIVCEISTPNTSYQQFGCGIVDKILFKRRINMVNIEAIKAEIEKLRNLTAEEYCKEDVAKIYADFEESRTRKIAEYERALEIFDEFQIVEEQVVETEVETANENAEDIVAE